MKHLYLIRHAKSSWKDDNLADKERPLRKRGERDARIMAKVVKKHGITPHKIVSSPAKRAFTTAKIFAEVFEYGEKKIEVNNHLYFEGIENIQAVIRQLDNKDETVFLFGHNPDFTNAANRVSKEEAIDNVPTSGVVGIEFRTDSWEDASFKNGTRTFFDFPSNHR